MNIFWGLGFFFRVILASQVHFQKKPYIVTVYKAIYTFNSIACYIHSTRLVKITLYVL